MNTKNHPGVYIPPPLIYAAFFLLSIALQKTWPFNDHLLHTTVARVVGGLLAVLFLLFVIPSMQRFIASKNTLVTIKPANSLQTTGIYAVTRNPMYLSLIFLYSGLAIFFGNWWTFMLLVPLVAIVRWYIIRKEENYLDRAFGDLYDAYKRKVRRWI